jgi:hypothetical protein
VSFTFRFFASIGLSLALHLAFLSYFDWLRTREQRAGSGPTALSVSLATVTSVDRDLQQQPSAGQDAASESSNAGEVGVRDRGDMANVLSWAESIPLKLPFERYRSLKELDKPPIPVDIPSLDGPELSGTTQRELVQVKVWINEVGMVDKVEVIAGNEDFAAKVREDFSRGRFIPGESGNRAVPSVIVIEVEYPEIR